MKRLILCIWMAAVLGPGLQVAEPAEAAMPLLTTFCNEGSSGGECRTPRSVATNPLNGDLYVLDEARVNVFSPWGQFIEAFGGGVLSPGAAGSGTVTPGSAVVTSVLTSEKAFLKGMTVAGTGIPPGDKIVALEGNTLTLARPATAAATGASTALSSPEAPGNVPVNELQRLVVSATGGRFTLTFEVREPSLSSQTTADVAYNASAVEVQAALEALPNLGPGNVAVSSANPGGEAGVPGGPYTIEFKGSRFADTDVRGLQARSSNSAPLSGGSAAVQPVRQGASAPEVCAGGDCVEGVDGSGAGQISGGRGIAIDSSGAVYVYESATCVGGESCLETFQNNRVQKFDAEGDFLLTFGKDVGKGPHHPGNLCTAQFIAEGDECDSGAQGGGPEEFGLGLYFGLDPAGSFIAIGPGDVVYVGGKERIQEFGPAGNYLKSISLPGETVSALAVDDDPGSPSHGDIYASFWEGNSEVSLNFVKPNVRKLDPGSGAVLDTLELLYPTALATDSNGNLYAFESGRFNSEGGLLDSDSEVVEFDSSGNEVQGFARNDLTGAKFTNNTTGLSLAASTACGIAGADVLLPSAENSAPAFVNLYGPPPNPALCPPPKLAPTIADQYAASVGSAEASLRAAINPHFWTSTTYYLQYGTGKCSEGGCTKEVPLAPGAQLSAKVVGNLVKTSAVSLAGLQPGTTYHYRFAAKTVFGPGEEAEVRGVGGEVGADGAEGTFTTHKIAPSPNTACPNQALRAGLAALLPDCRAYELVSPLDKNGADIATLPNVTGFPAGLDQANPDGEALTFTAYRAFGDATSGPYGVQYLAERGPAGWSSRSLSPPREGGTFLSSAQLDREYRAFSADLSEGWLFRQTDPLLDPAAPAGYPNLYRRLPGGGYEVAVSTVPPAAPAEKFIPELQGTGGGCTVFSAIGKLTEDASAAGGAQLYETCEGTTSLLSVTPSGGAAPKASAGTPHGATERSADLHNAVSADGQTVFWSNAESGTGKLFARIGGSETIALSKNSAQFLTAAKDGSKAIYAEGGQLLEFTLGVNAKEEGTPIAKGFIGFLAASEDASRVYFLSSEELAAGATPGKPNLYLYEAGEPGSFDFIATLAASDAIAEGAGLPTPVELTPIYHVAQASADGGALLFDSVAPLTGYDNTDQKSGKPDLEVFVYRAGPGKLACASCDPSGARPSGQFITFGKVVNHAEGEGISNQPTAATIPAAESSLYTPRALAANGRRAFFTSYVPLSLRDTNGAADAYQWEEAGEGDCTEGSQGFSASWEGCVELLSSGQSPVDSELVDSGADGRDAFFATTASLIAADPGLRDIYDARIGGGFPVPAPTAACEGEACQGPYSPPNDPTPSSSAFEGPGNVRKAKAKHKQRKKKHKQHKKKNKKARENKRVAKKGSMK